MSIADHKSSASTPNKKAKRNSSIELLRIIAMLMIIAHHYLVHSGFKTIPPFSAKLFFFLFIQSFGKIGVLIFFTISAWYLCMEKRPTMRKSLKRAWLLEREVLFYSLTLMSLFLLLGRQYISKSVVVLSLFPTISSRVWWYVTAYIIFLVLCPSLTKGLRAIGKGTHSALCAVLLIGWGFIAGMLPNTILDSEVDGFINFLFIYVLVSFYRWYLDDWNSRTAWIMIIAGILTIALAIISIQTLGLALGSDSIRAHANYISQSCVKLPVLLIGFGMMILFERKYYTNKVINTIASTTFGIYLIHDYPAVREMLNGSSINLNAIYNNPQVILTFFIIIFTVFFSCMLMDLLRQCLFKITVDRHEGQVFERLYDSIAIRKWAQQLNSAIMKKSIPHESLISGKDLLEQADNPIPPTPNSNAHGA
ncbi:acyltransferase family protein [Bifidobacterium animalis]|nr:acyltransferase [Bifidobacterium animalis]ANU43110.2 hypothetical protein A4U98_00400 [Bifidobacterium animalis subsp. animalis]PHQ53713.1 acyltransferase [Bifidobacterium animalis subsp. animalis]QQQ90760.1 acyltransferase [Bifidobacterium animalis]UQE62744.1 acyltransferase [Bifidobacterium animalis]